MPQNMTSSTTLEVSETKILNEPISVETYADDLMEEIFQPVERVLEGGTRLPSEPVKPEFVSLKSVQVPQIILPLAPETEAETDTTLRDANAETTRPSFDRILLGAAVSSLLITLLLGLATRGGLGRLFGPEPVAVPVEPVLDAQTKADIKFVEYIERSLTNIEQKTAENVLIVPPLPNLPPASNLPPLAVPGTPDPLAANTAANTNNLVAAINRVAEAIQDASNQTAALSNQVMTTLQTQMQNKPPASPTPANTPVPGGRSSGNVAAPPTASQTQAAPQAQNQAASAPQLPQSPPATVNTVPAPPPQAVTPAAPASAPAATEPQSTAAANPQPVTAHTLVGILELGDRSAALFEIDGVARRIYVGESIGASGWALVEVSNQEAVIRRNGEVRTIFVGQQF